MLSKEAKEAKRQYMREWRKKNKARLEANQEAYWERKAQELKTKQNNNQE